MKRWRRPPLQHPLAPIFARAVESLSTALSPATQRNYNIAVRSFLVYLGAQHPSITGLEQLRRDPHILGWMSRMRAGSAAGCGNLHRSPYRSARHLERVGMDTQAS